MRIITGNFRGLKLYSPKDYSVRPTSDKVKEAVFSAIQFRLENCYFLDLFSGSGQMGMEALSRGAKSVTFVDNNRTSVSIVQKNLSLVDGKYLKQSVQIKNSDALSFLKSIYSVSDKYDIIFMDPPYCNDFLNELISLSYDCINSNGIAICEHSSEYKLPDKINNMILLRKYSYGKTVISMYKPISEEIGC